MTIPKSPHSRNSTNIPKHPWTCSKTCTVELNDLFWSIMALSTIKIHTYLFQSDHQSSPQVQDLFPSVHGLFVFEIKWACSKESTDLFEGAMDLFQRVYRSIYWRSNGSIPKCQWMYSIEGLKGPVPKCPQTYSSVKRSYLFNRAMNLSQCLHGFILFKEAMGLPKSDLGLFSLLFWFWFENAMAMFQRVHGVTPESEWPPALGSFLFVLFLFRGHNSPVQKCPWTFFFFLLLFLFLFCFVLRMQWPHSKKCHGATPESPWPPPALAAWPACGPSAAPWRRLRSATSRGISASYPLGKICWLKTRGHLVTVLESFPA